MEAKESKEKQDQRDVRGCLEVSMIYLEDKRWTFIGVREENLVSQEFLVTKDSLVLPEDLE